MSTDLERAYRALAAKGPIYDRLWRYYDGDHPVVYTNERLREIFKTLDARFTENWCAVVVDSVGERIQLTGLSSGDSGATEALDTFWAQNELNLEADDAHQAALVTGEAFLIVWPEEDGGPPACYYNDPRMCHIIYDAENPRHKTFAAKWWDTDGGRRRLTLYYPDRLLYYIGPDRGTLAKLGKDGGRAFEPLPDEPEAQNPYGEIPVFHLRTGRRPISELANVIAPQNGINKLLIDMMVAAEFGAFRQRWVISHAETSGNLKNAPNEIWDLPAGDGMGQPTQVGEFSATDLGNYLGAIDRLAGGVAAITRTPKHLFFGQGGDPSGEALIALEAPLNKKAQARIERFTPVWRRVAAFALKVAGKEVPLAEITPTWERPETVQPLTRANIRQVSVASGIPLRTVLKREEGWTAADLEELEEDRAEETAGQGNIGAMILKAFEAGQQ